MNQEHSHQEHSHVDASDDTIQFLASLPPIQSAVQRSGSGDGMQIKLSIPESEMANAIRIQLWDRKPLAVTIRVLEPEDIEPEDIYPEDTYGNQIQNNQNERDASTDGNHSEAAAPVRRQIRRRI